MWQLATHASPDRRLRVGACHPAPQTSMLMRKPCGPICEIYSAQTTPLQERHLDGAAPPNVETRGSRGQARRRAEFHRRLVRFAKFIPSTVPRHIADRRKFGSCEIVHMTSKNDRRQRWARGGMVTCDYFRPSSSSLPATPATLRRLPGTRLARNPRSSFPERATGGGGDARTRAGARGGLEHGGHGSCKQLRPHDACARRKGTASPHPHSSPLGAHSPVPRAHPHPKAAKLRKHCGWLWGISAHCRERGVASTEPG